MHHDILEHTVWHYRFTLQVDADLVDGWVVATLSLGCISLKGGL